MLCAVALLAGCTGNPNQQEQQPAEPSVPVETTDGYEADEPEPVKEETTEPAEPQGPMEPAEGAEGQEAPAAATSHRHPQELVAQGISFLTGLAETLQSPEATEQLVDSIVETNAETGESHLRIPVPDKQTVSTLLNLVGKLFAK